MSLRFSYKDIVVKEEAYVVHYSFSVVGKM